MPTIDHFTGLKMTRTLRTYRHEPPRYRQQDNKTTTPTKKPTPTAARTTNAKLPTSHQPPANSQQQIIV
jgi:hypothetical protein